MRGRTLPSALSIRKRSGQVVPFDLTKIVRAVHKALMATGEGDEAAARLVAEKVYLDVLKIKRVSRDKQFLPEVEMVQDLAEEELMLQGYRKTAKAYILYREKRATLRRRGKAVPERVRELVAESKKYFRNPLAEFVYFRTYARWLDGEGRRETWVETVDRFTSYMRSKLGNALSADEYGEVQQAILTQAVMPSMRLLQFAGPPADSTNVCAYNCSYTAPRQIADFSEVMYALMCGTGVGFSVESRNIQALPQIAVQTGERLPAYRVPDSKEGWADALTYGLNAWFSGRDVDFDFSRIRPAGARLKTMGGKASGPEPLRQLLEFARHKVLRRQGRRLTNLDAHDILCKIGDCVVAGGVRRSAMISLSDLDDVELRDAKQGQFYVHEPQRMLANNSAVYEERPTAAAFLREWLALVQSGTGERGIFNRGSLKAALPARRLAQFTDRWPQWGSNPCGEIILQPKQFCNLSEVVARAQDSAETLLRKVRLAAILGTYQATLTNFPYLSKAWRENCEAERLLGVSITGQWDCLAVRQAGVLKKLRDCAVATNRKYAKKFGISAATCVTCVKPSGTVSQLVDSASGMHPRHAAYYLRRVRISATDSLFHMLRDQGVPYYPEVGQSTDAASTLVLEFPVRAPRGAVTKDDLSALDQLKHWYMLKTNYTEHNPSVTISAANGEWLEVANWLYRHWDYVGGLSFLPRSDHAYQLAPYEAITRQRYVELARRIAHLDYAKIVTYERENETDAKAELACVGGVCEIEI